MRYKIRFIFFGILFVFSFLNLSFSQEFSADVISKSQGTTVQGKIFVGKNKVRLETPQVITISILDTKTVYLLMPDQKMYMRVPLEASNLIAGEEKMDSEIERKFLGKENIDGKLADKYRVVYLLNNKRENILTWISTDTKIPLKTASEDGLWSQEFKNIKVENQPDYLFVVPSDYQEFQSPIGGLKDLNIFNKDE